MNSFFIAIFILVTSAVYGQSFAPAPDNPGSTAIYKDSSVFVAWATNVYIQRGYLDIQNPQSGFASYGTDTDAVGPADGANVVSLGDSGLAILQFAQAIYDGPGPDFAVFENGFIDGYMEFAFVEVSSDGVNYFRFPATSEIPTTTQSGNFTVTDCGYVHNLAGKYRANYGTPFDLADFSGVTALDVQHITHIKLIDVVGSIDPQWGSQDQYGVMINDPYPTAFESGGFDLDAIGVIHQKPLGIEVMGEGVQVYPNPFDAYLNIQIAGVFSYTLYTSNGAVVRTGESSDNIKLNTTDLVEGVYFLYLYKDGATIINKIVK